MSNRGELRLDEPHPAAKHAAAWIGGLGLKKTSMLLESFSSCAIESNRDAEICSETLDRIMKGQPVSDRYVLGLAWYVRHILETK